MIDEKREDDSEDKQTLNSTNNETALKDDVCVDEEKDNTEGKAMKKWMEMIKKASSDKLHGSDDPTDKNIELGKEEKIAPEKKTNLKPPMTKIPIVKNKSQNNMKRNIEKNG